MFCGQTFPFSNGLFDASDLVDLRGQPHRRFRNLRGALLGLDLDRVLPTGAGLQGLSQRGQPRDIGLDRAIEPDHLAAQLPQLALPRQDGCIGRSRSDEQHPLPGDQFALHRDEPTAAPRRRREMERSVEGVHDPRIGEQPRGQAGDATRLRDKLIGPLNNSRLAAQIGPLAAVEIV